MEKKLLSLLLVLCMVLCLVPTTAFAEENTDLTDTQVVETEGEKKADPPAPQSQEVEQKPVNSDTPPDGNVQDTKDSTPPAEKNVSAAPPKPDEETVKNLITVRVNCTSVKHAPFDGFTSGTKAGTFQIGDVQYTAETGYTCTVTVSADKYVTAYSLWIEGDCNHTPNDSTETITLKYENGSWTAGDDSRVRFSVYDTYTVTYTDGVDSEVIFEDQTTGNLKTGDKTPAFGDGINPVREGYQFKGWSPAVADTVTENVTYVAQWQEYKKPSFSGIKFKFLYVDPTLENGYQAVELTEDAQIESGSIWERGIQMDANGNRMFDCVCSQCAVDATCTIHKMKAVDIRLAAQRAQNNYHALRSGYGYVGWTMNAGSNPTIRAFSSSSAEADSTEVTPNETVIYFVAKPVYTVTYTDGVDGVEIFKDQTYTVESGKATPAFSGTPTREGYQFTGWSPAVADTVTENVTYVAQWQEYKKPSFSGIKFKFLYVDPTLENGYQAVELTEDAQIESGSIWERGIQMDANGNRMFDCVCSQCAVDATCTIHKMKAVDIRLAAQRAQNNYHALRSGYGYVGWTMNAGSNPTIRAFSSSSAEADSTEVTPNETVIYFVAKPVYTVTYTDGVDGVEIFKDQTYTVESGKATPAFSGTPTREGYKFTGWSPAVTDTVTGDATYTAKWERAETPPTSYENLNLACLVTVSCKTAPKQHVSAISRLLEDSYTVTTPVLKDGVWTCTLTVKAGKYVDAFSKLYGKHTLDDAASKDITLIWKNKKNNQCWWAATDAEKSVTFNVKCDLYTVTYTDGVSGKEVFKDVVYEDLAYGVKTPDFGTKNPTRKGYTFAGWTPKVADTVTKDVTYTATWKSNSGKDNVPKTGDGELVMVLGSVLLFSFCGAAAVCVCGRKRRQG